MFLLQTMSTQWLASATTTGSRPGLVASSWTKFPNSTISFQSFSTFHARPSSEPDLCRTGAAQVQQCIMPS